MSQRLRDVDWSLLHGVSLYVTAYTVEPHDACVQCTRMQTANGNNRLAYRFVDKVIC
jgi:hypothetical protein